MLKVIKLNEINNLIQTAGSLQDINIEEESKELNELKKQILTNLTSILNQYSNDTADLHEEIKNIDSLNNSFQTGGKDISINTDKEYDFINKNILKLNKLNDKYLSNDSMKLIDQLEYSDDNTFTELDDLDTNDDIDPNLLKNLPNLNKPNNNQQPNIQPNIQQEQPNIQKTNTTQNIQSFSSQLNSRSNIDSSKIIKLQSERDRILIDSKKLNSENAKLKSQIAELASSNQLNPNEKDMKIEELVIKYSKLGDLYQDSKTILQNLANSTK